MHLRTVCQAIMVMTLASMSSALAAPTCPIDFGKRASLKPNKLYLFFPAAELKEGQVRLPITRLRHGI